MDRRADILIVEDNPGDTILLREAFTERGSDVRLSFARDGPEAFDRLRREDLPAAPRPGPDLPRPQDAGHGRAYLPEGDARRR